MKSREFLEQHGWSVVGETIDATRVRKGREAALELARSVSTVVVAKGKMVVTFDMKVPQNEDAVAAAMLGPTGNLKAPTLRIGDMLLVGFGEAAYQQVLARGWPGNADS